MSSKKPIGLGLIIGLLALAFAALPALASAAPTFEPTGGPGAFPIPFTSSSGPSILKAGGIEVNCTDSTNAGELLNSTEDRVTVTFTGCEIVGLGKCTTAPLAAGTIATNTLRSTLVYLDAAPHSKFGILLEPMSGAVLAEFSCAGIPVVVSGSVIGQITEPALEAVTGGFTLTLAEAGGEQEFRQVEGAGPEHTLTAEILGEELPAVEITEDVVTLIGETGEFRP